MVSDDKNSSNRIHADKKFVRGVAIAISIAWVFWLLLVIGIVIGNLFYVEMPHIDEYLPAIIGFVAVYSVFAFVLLTRPICEVCGNKVFSEPVRVHPNFTSRKWLGGWATIVVDLVITKSFVCMHCGETISREEINQD